MPWAGGEHICRNAGEPVKSSQSAGDLIKLPKDSFQEVEPIGAGHGVIKTIANAKGHLQLLAQQAQKFQIPIASIILDKKLNGPFQIEVILQHTLPEKQDHQGIDGCNQIVSPQ